MSEVPLASGLADEDTTYGLLFPRETETFGSVDVVPGSVKLHPGFSVRKFELRTRRYGRRIGSAGGFSGGSPAAAGSGRNSGPRVVFLVSLLEKNPRHPRSELDLLRCVRVAANIRKSEAYKTLVLPG
jgi:hypothetical protein